MWFCLQQISLAPELSPVWSYRVLPMPTLTFKVDDDLAAKLDSAVDYARSVQAPHEQPIGRSEIIRLALEAHLKKTLSEADKGLPTLQELSERLEKLERGDSPGPRKLIKVDREHRSEARARKSSRA